MPEPVGHKLKVGAIHRDGVLCGTVARCACQRWWKRTEAVTPHAGGRTWAKKVYATHRPSA